VFVPEPEPEREVLPGDCGSISDQDVWLSIKDSFNDKMNDCAGLDTDCTSIFGVDEECVGECMVRKYSFSYDCGYNFGLMAGCGYLNCKWPCISGNPHDPDCMECNE
jgi:hypothetical protein